MSDNKVIFFDFDGVIADSLSIAFEVARMSRPHLTLDKYRAYFDGNIHEVNHEDGAVRKVDFIEEYGKRFEDLGIEEQKTHVIRKLSESFRLFIISSTTGGIIRSYLQQHGILSCFTDILGNEVHQSKVEKFQMLFQKYNIDPNEVIFITDTTGDIKEAKKAGVQTIVGIAGGFQENLERENPSIIVRDFAQFYDFVQKQI